jgi:D-serine deaminase-like pyridoxal phosphate-dependent protein
LQLSTRCNLSVVADNSVCVKGLSETFKKQDKPLQVLVECDTGALRCGVVTPEEALSLAQEITDLPGLKFGGLMTYPPISQQENVNRFLEATKKLIEENGITVNIVSIGGSPNMWEVEKIPIGTEYRIGTYIYNDRSLMERKVCKEEDCALTVLATVVSTPTPQRAVIDAGSKVLTTDLFGLEGHGHIIDHEQLTISQLSEEHACIVSDGPTGLSIGQKVRIIPNHACVVSNMVDEVVFIEGGKVLKSQSVVARGKVL